jgi:hypothetical protein
VLFRLISRKRDISPFQKHTKTHHFHLFPYGERTDKSERKNVKKGLKPFGNHSTKKEGPSESGQPPPPIHKRPPHIVPPPPHHPATPRPRDGFKYGLILWVKCVRQGSTERRERFDPKYHANARLITPYLKPYIFPPRPFAFLSHHQTDARPCVCRYTRQATTPTRQPLLHAHAVGMAAADDDSSLGTVLWAVAGLAICASGKK